MRNKGNKKCRAGKFGVYHAGTMEYLVYNDETGRLVDEFSNLMQASALASRLYYADRFVGPME